jgi:integrase
LAAAVLFVRRSVQPTSGGLTFVPPKTHRSARPVPLSALAVRELQRQRVRQARERLRAGELWAEADLVFANTIGIAVEPRNVNRRFAGLRASVGLDWLLRTQSPARYLG